MDPWRAVYAHNEALEPQYGDLEPLNAALEGLKTSGRKYPSF